jgi:zinc transport system ATP-binding protein
MDAESEDRLFASLGKLKGKTTILLVTHDTGFVSDLTDRVLCMGRGETAGRYGIVQHRTETAAAHALSPYGSRVVHGESIPADSCFGGGPPPETGNREEP